MRRILKPRAVALFAALVLVVAVATTASAATLYLINFDPPGAGLNDPTPAAPVGGNPGTTLGDQRINVYLYAANLWGSVIDSSEPIYVGASFAPLSCTPTSGTLGSAGTTFIFRDFPGAPLAGTWYHSALTDALYGGDGAPGYVDINSRFNSSIGTDPGCLTGRNWYYGLDGNEGNDFDFLAVVTHEIAHGLGFSNFVNEATGAMQSGFTDVYNHFTYDTTTGMTWEDMATDADRAAAAVNDRNEVWIGPEVAAEAPSVLGPRPSLVVLNPFDVAGSYEVQTATFGAPLGTGGGVSGLMVVANDGTGDTADACEPLITPTPGKIVLVNRGACTFVQKAANAQAAGAKGIVVANNTAVGLPGMGGTDPSITIPAIGITQALGAALKAAWKPNLKLVLDSNVLAGTQDGWLRIYAPNPVASGSSGSHWDVTATPNLLMEPFINPDLAPTVTLDLTPALLQDIGWTLLP